MEKWHERNFVTCKNCGKEFRKQEGYNDSYVYGNCVDGDSLELRKAAVCGDTDNKSVVHTNQYYCDGCYNNHHPCARKCVICNAGNIGEIVIILVIVLMLLIFIST